MLLFKPEHVPLILNGTKTQTRRNWKQCRVTVGSIQLAKTQMLIPPSFGICDHCRWNDEGYCFNPKWKLGMAGMRIMRKHKRCVGFVEAPPCADDIEDMVDDIEFRESQGAGEDGDQ